MQLIFQSCGFQSDLLLGLGGLTAGPVQLQRPTALLLKRSNVTLPSVLVRQVTIWE